MGYFGTRKRMQSVIATMTTPHAMYVVLFTVANPFESILVMNSTKNMMPASWENTPSITRFSLRMSGRSALYSSFSSPA